MSNRSTKQKRNDLDIFHEIFEKFKWVDMTYTEPAKEIQGEGVRVFHTSKTYFQVQLHLPIQMLSLHIKDIDSEDFRILHMLYEENPSDYLNWIGKSTKIMTLYDYPLFISSVFQFPGMVLLQLMDGNLLDLQPHNPSKTKDTTGPRFKRLKIPTKVSI